MKRRIVVAGVLGAAAMVGGALFPLVIALFGPGQAGGATPLTSAPDVVVVASVLMVLPGAIGLYLAHGEAFGPLSQLAVTGLVVGLLLVLAVTAAESTLGSVPGGETVWRGITSLLVVGSVGTGLATATGKTLTHARVGGGLLALSVLAFVGTGPVLSVLASGLPSEVTLALATGPMGLAWLVLGYDMLTLQDLSIQPTRIVPAEE